MKNVTRALIMTLALTLVLSVYSFSDAGADTFKAKCASCHGATGAGDTTIGKNMKLRDLGSAEVQGQSDDALTTVIAKGKGKMPAYENKVSKEQIGDLVKYIRTLKK